ncbi:MAG: hypothetical protein ABIJ56_01255 [Pseudomonadota bacterium]
MVRISTKPQIIMLPVFFTVAAACGWFSSSPVGFAGDAYDGVDSIDEEASDTFVEQPDVLEEDMIVDEAAAPDVADGWDWETVDSAGEIEDAIVEEVPGECETNEDCDDGDPCSGTEACSSGGRCEPGRPLEDLTDCSTPSLESGFCLDAVCVPHDCGDGIRTGGEGCDDASGFCSESCLMQAPSGWIECEDEEGRKVYLRVELPVGNSTWTEFSDFCKNLVEEEDPVNFSYYGLAVLADRNVWDCLEPHLVTTRMFYIGLFQDDTDPEYSEPDGGWAWWGFDGSDWTGVAPHDIEAYFLPGFFDNSAVSDTAEIVRIRYGFYTTGWEVHDWSILMSENWGGVCMVRF